MSQKSSLFESLFPLIFLLIPIATKILSKKKKPITPQQVKNRAGFEKKPAFKKQHSEKKKYALNLKEFQKQEKETSCMEKPKVVAKEKGSKFFLKNNLKRSIVLSEILKTKY
jgi:hypothetical protein